MARIKIEDLPEEMDLSDAEMKKAFGGIARSLPKISVYTRQWATPGVRIITPGVFAQEPLETEPV